MSAYHMFRSRPIDESAATLMDCHPSPRILPIGIAFVVISLILTFFVRMQDRRDGVIVSIPGDADDFTTAILYRQRQRAVMTDTKGASATVRSWMMGIRQSTEQREEPTSDLEDCLVELDANAEPEPETTIDSETPDAINWHGTNTLNTSWGYML